MNEEISAQEKAAQSGCPEAAHRLDDLYLDLAELEEEVLKLKSEKKGKHAGS